MANTTNLTAIEVDALTNEQIVRNLTKEELAEIAIEKNKPQLSKEEVEAEIASRQSARQAALAKLAALGLTEAEIAAL
jgi:hypothetical protein